MTPRTTNHSSTTVITLLIGIGAGIATTAIATTRAWIPQTSGPRRSHQRGRHRRESRHTPRAPHNKAKHEAHKTVEPIRLHPRNKPAPSAEPSSTRTRETY